MSQDAAATFILGGPWRAACGVLLLALATTALWVGRTIEWGVAWTTVIPAVLLLVPAWGLLHRRVLAWHGSQLELTDGWLWRRCLALPVAGAELEVLPTAGLCAVVLHRGGGARTIATWIRPATARRLAAWLDTHHPGGPFPRRVPALPVGDR